MASTIQETAQLNAAVKLVRALVAGQASVEGAERELKELEVPPAIAHAAAWIVRLEQEKEQMRIQRDTMPKNIRLVLETALNAIEAVQSAHFTEPHTVYAGAEDLEGARADIAQLLAEVFEA